MSVFFPSTTMLKDSPAWADGLRTGDLFFFRPTGKTMLIVSKDEVAWNGPFGRHMTVVEFPPLVHTEPQASCRTNESTQRSGRHGDILA